MLQKAMKTRKNRSKGIIFLGISFSIILFISSCSNNHCDQSMTTPLVISFYLNTDTSQQVSPRFLMIEGVDSPYYIDASGKSSVQLSLRKFDGLSRFLFKLANDESPVDTLLVITEDVLSIRHTNTQDFVSAECGCLTTYYIDEVQFTSNGIGDVSITSHTVTNSYNEKHIKIYFKGH